jgi:hypothetical protein
MPTLNSRHDLPGRIVAFIVFLLGVALLCIVFAAAWSLFRAPVPGLELPVKPGAPAPPAAGIGIALTAFVRQLLLLALMTLAGSLIASKGVHLYFSATENSPRRATPADSSHEAQA